MPKLKLGAKGEGGPGLFKMPKFGQKCLVQTNNYKQTYKYNTHTHLAASACMTQGTIGRVCVQYTCTHNKQTSHYSNNFIYKDTFFKTRHITTTPKFYCNNLDNVVLYIIINTLPHL